MSARDGNAAARTTVEEAFPPALAARPEPAHLPTLDGIRGLAIIMVLVFHFVGNVPPTSPVENLIAGVANYGAYGVELFFVLSGFLITGILYDNAKRGHYFRNFYMRRLLRISPLYFGVLAAVFFIAPLLPLLRGPTLNFLTEHQAWAWLYCVNVYIAIQGYWSFSYLDHFWSLAVEEHFYLFWPFVVFALSARASLLRNASLGIALGAMLARLIGSVMGLSWWTVYVLTPFRLDGLALGAFLGILVRQPAGWDRLTLALPKIFIFLGGTLLASFAWTRLVSRDFMIFVQPVRASLILMLLAGFLAYTVTASKTSVVHRIFSSKAMTFFGTYSYGLYVYHHFISYYLVTHRTDLELGRWLGSHGAAIALQASAGVLISVALAYVSFEYFEKWFLSWKRLFR